MSRMKERKKKKSRNKSIGILIIIFIIAAGVYAAKSIYMPENEEEGTLVCIQDLEIPWPEMFRIEGVGSSTGYELTIPKELTPCTVDEKGNLKVINYLDTEVEYIAKNIINGIIFVDSIGNEYVWIPVNGSVNKIASSGKINYARQDFNKNNIVYKSLSETMGEEKASIEKYKGFFVMRYEAGDPEAKKGRNMDSPDTIIPVSKKGVQIYNHITRNEAIELSNNYANNYEYTSLSSKIMTSFAWDALMNYTGLNGKDIYDSRDWGNYKNSTYDALESSGGSKFNGLTGRSDAWQVGNVYDLAGSVSEWTTELCTEKISPIVVRGGGYHDGGESVSAAYRLVISDTYNSETVGFRCMLYLNP